MNKVGGVEIQKLKNDRKPLQPIKVYNMHSYIYGFY